MANEYLSYRIKLLLRLLSLISLSSLLTVANAASNSYQIRYQSQVNQLLANIRSPIIWNSLAQLTAFPDRAADSVYGVAAANWIKSQLELIADESGRKDINIYTVETKTANTTSKQFSIIIKIGSSNNPGIVIGTHFDTYKKYDLASSIEECKTLPPKIQKMCIDTMSSDKPGADDDGSGSAALLEVAHTVLTSKMTFNNPIYLIWYADEEDGFIGSQAVVADFAKNNIPVAAVMQLDQIGFTYANDPTMWLVTNYVDSKLTSFLADLIKEYVKQPIKYTASKGPASDSYVWYSQGISTAFPFESEMELGKGNITVHTKQDTMDKLSLAHITDYAKLAVAFAIELAEPTGL